MINNNGCLEALTEAAITADHFSGTLHRDIYLSCCEIFDNGQQLDGIVVINHLREKGQHGEESIRNAVHNMAKANFLINDIPPHIEILLKYKFKREEVIEAGALLERAYGNNGHYETSPGKTLNAKDLMGMEFKEVKFLVQNLIATGATILAGKPKIGKSLLCLNLAVSVSSGGYALGNIPVEKRGVLYLALEDTPRRLKSRLQKILQNQAAPENLFLITEFSPINEGGAEALNSWIGQHPDVGLVIIDTLAKVKGRTARNSELYLEDYAVVSKIKKIADDHNIAIVIVHHTRKLIAGDVFDSISGTTGLTGAADTNIVFKKDRGQADAEMCIVGRDIEEQELALKFDSNILSWILIGNADEFRLSQERRSIIDLLKDAEGAMSTKKIAEGVDKAVNATSNLLQKLVTSGHVSQAGRGFYSININVNDVNK